jgi:selenocysteine lyase/cysteine desulfurase
MAFGKQSVEQCRRDFPALSRTLDGRPLAYLDGPAGTQVPRQVIEAVAAYYQTCNANTHGAFVTSRESDEMILASPSWITRRTAVRGWTCASRASWYGRWRCAAKASSTWATCDAR